MESRILHLAVAQKIIEQVKIKDTNQFRLGMLLPDAYTAETCKADSHLKILVCGGSKKTYDLTKFRYEFKKELKDNEMYLGYYLHLIQDLIFRRLVYEEYMCNPSISANSEKLHQDYLLIDQYVIGNYSIKNDIEIVESLWKEKVYLLYSFDVGRMIKDLRRDYNDKYSGEALFFTKAMANEFISKAADICTDEIHALRNGKTVVDEYSYAWKNKDKSLLITTENTRDLGGYKTKDGKVTKWNCLIRSDVQSYSCEEDLLFMKEHKITTVIDLRGEKDVISKPSGFANAKDIDYYNCPIDEGSGVPESVEAVPVSYLHIACAANIAEVFKHIARSDGGVLFHCTAGKDRTGVVSAILLNHVRVKDEDIIENYVLTKEYGQERLDLVHKNFPELDMNIVTPNERYMESFLKLFRERFGNTDNYFRGIGLSPLEIRKITELIVGR